MLNIDTLAERVLRGDILSVAEGVELLNLPDTETLRLVDAAWRVRREAFGDQVKVNVLLNAKSGLCAEDCSYCSQAKGADTGIPRYRVLTPDEMVGEAKKAQAAGAQRYCIVLSGRGGTWGEVGHVTEATRRIKAETNLEVCACMGLLLGEDGQKKAQALREAGVDAYNHNLNTHQDNYEHICSTHSYDDRVETLTHAAAAGMSTCSGVIVGMGESAEQIVELAATLRQRRADSIPVNFLIPIDGAALDGKQTTAHFTPWYCLRVLCVFRLLNPRAELRASAGREIHLRSLQPLALLIANSMFLGNYLTEEGQEAGADWQMLDDLGLRPASGGARASSEIVTGSEGMAGSEVVTAGQVEQGGPSSVALGAD